MNASSETRGQKEIRFTRNAQAVHFFLLGLGFFCIGLTLWLLSLDVWTVSTGPVLESPWWALTTLPFIAASTWWGIHLAKHAYMIFSPVGIELFPFFFPSKNMEVFYWSEIGHVSFEANQGLLEISLAGEAERKVFVTTTPLNRASRALLAKTIEGIQARRSASPDSLEDRLPESS